MGRPYSKELDELKETYEWARGIDIRPIAATIARAAPWPLIAVGSGGSLTVAHSLVHLHRHCAGGLAMTTTPLLLETTIPADARTSVWLLSAAGRNEDIRAAFRHAVGREPRHLAVLCGNPTSPLARDLRQYAWVDAPLVPLARRDGFLATNSVVAFAVLLARGYAALVGDQLEHDGLSALLEATSPDHGRLSERCEPLWSRSTLIVLHGRTTAAAAFDLESRFTEAGLGVVQLADFRNFAHGRHHWLAKHGPKSAVLALAGPEDTKLAKATLRSLPDDIPSATIAFSGSTYDVLLSSIVVSMRIAGGAGRVRGIDPGRPGVPEFGRRLYHMKAPRMRQGSGKADASTARAAAAITRKARCTVSALRSHGILDSWNQALATFETGLRETVFRGLVCDYDGTIVDATVRTEPPTADIVAWLVRFLRADVVVGIATGRGDSVWRDLRNVLPEETWSRVVVGYHNGAVIQTLEEEPVLTQVRSDPSLRKAAAVFERERVLLGIAPLRSNAHQLTVTPSHGTSEEKIWLLVVDALRRQPVEGLRVVRSSHSVDIIPSTSSKLRVVEEVRRRVGGAVLTIGDRGCWPGNDNELLTGPHSLSVDEVSTDPAAAWNLAPPGHRGIGALLYYFGAIRLRHSEFCVELGEPS